MVAPADSRVVTAVTFTLSNTPMLPRSEGLDFVRRALHFAHEQRIAADMMGALRDPGRIGERLRFHDCLPYLRSQWMSMPPLTSITAPVT